MSGRDSLQWHFERRNRHELASMELERRMTRHISRWRGDAILEDVWECRNDPDI